jgi:hypothetical protein
MAKLRIKASQITDADVLFVSLVDRGANRIPYRIIKQDNNMINLHNLFKREIPKGTSLVGVALSSDDLAKKSEALLEKFGFTRDTRQKTEDGSALFMKPGNHDEYIVLKHDDNLMLMVGGRGITAMIPAVDLAQKADTASAGFYDFIKEDGIYGMASRVCDAMPYMIYRAVTNALTQQQASANVASLCAAFADYMTTLAKTLPPEAFLLVEGFEGAITVEAAEVEAKADDSAPEAPAESPAEAPAETPERPAEGDGEASSKEDAQEPKEENADSAVAAKAEVKKKSEMDYALEALRDLKDMVSSLYAKADAAEALSKDTAVKAEQALLKAESAASLAKGTVATSPGSLRGDPLPVKAEKKDKLEPIGLIDTAFQHRSRSNA